MRRALLLVSLSWSSWALEMVKRRGALRYIGGVALAPGLAVVAPDFAFADAIIPKMDAGTAARPATGVILLSAPTADAIDNFVMAEVLLSNGVAATVDFSAEIPRF